MFDDTALIRIVIEELHNCYNWTYEEALERFFSSKVCAKISDKNTGLFTCAPIEIVGLFAEELEEQPMNIFSLSS